MPANKKSKPQRTPDEGLKRVQFMLPESLRQKLRRESFEREVSMSSIVVDALKKRYQES